MIAKTIKESTSKKTQKPYWAIELEGTDRPMLLWTKPQFNEGDDIPEEDIELKGKEGNQYWAFKATSTPKTESRKGSKSYTADPQKIESIEFQNARNNAVTLYCQVTKQGDEFDNALLTKLYKACETLGKDVISVAKKEYHAVEADK